jgi:hypothetical protein
MNNTTPDQTGSFGGDVTLGAKAGARSMRREGADGFWIVFVMIGVLVVVSGVTLISVAEPGHLRMLSSNPSPCGYTTSLLVFVLPVVPWGWWFMQHPEYRLARESFWKTILTLIPLGFVLDLIFGNVFFHFPNLEATLGVGIPAVGGPIPVEEFLFYIGGFLAVLLCYIWADEYWLRSSGRMSIGCAATRPQIRIPW